MMMIVEVNNTSSTRRDIVFENDLMAEFEYSPVAIAADKKVTCRIQHLSSNG